MERVPQLPVPSGVAEWFGDYDWLRRSPSPFYDPSFDGLGIESDAALRELADVYTRTDVRKLVEQGHMWIVLPLFGGLIVQVEEKLLLGHDLLLCHGWRDQKKFVGGLRSAAGYHERRVEAGAWAGLCRAGYAPDVELADDPGCKRADFVVEDDGLRIAIEVKVRSDPAFERNRRELTYLLTSILSLGKGPDWRADVDLRLSSDARRWLRKPVLKFVADHWRMFEAELRDAVPQVRHGVQIALPSLGTLIVGPTAHDDGAVGSYGLLGADPLPVERLAQLVMYKIREAAEQLAATPADRRVAVVHGSADIFDADLIIDALPDALAEQKDDLIAKNIDWIVVINCEAVSPGEAWLRQVAVLPVAGAKHDLPARIVRGLVAWGSPRG